MSRQCLVFFCGLLAATTLVHSQAFRATLTGRVLDSAGAPVPNAKVRVTNASTAEARDVVTDSQGNYLVPLLNPSMYSIRAEAQGFQTAIREGLQLNVNQTATIDLKLEVGAMSTQITVTADVPLLDDANADLGGLIDAESVKEYPLNARNPFMLAILSPGVNFDGELTYQRPFDNGAIAEWSINGSQRKNEFLLDGAPNNAQAGGNNIAYVPPVDAVQEFKIQSNSYDAQYGRKWLLQEVTTRLPGRIDPVTTAFASANDLASALRRAAAAHGKHEARTGQADPNWPDWYAEHMVREQSGQELPQ